MSQHMMVIIAMGMTVFSVRSVAFIFANYITLPTVMKEAFELLPPAILTVIVANGVLIDPYTESMSLSLTDPDLVAVLFTLMIASRIKNFFAVIFGGYSVYLFLNMWMGG